MSYRVVYRTTFGSGELSVVTDKPYMLDDSGNLLVFEDDKGAHETPRRVLYVFASGHWLRVEPVEPYKP